MIALGGFALFDPPPGGEMLILRGIAGENAPRGLLDDRAALAYARALGYSGRVLDIAANGGAQVERALDEIRNDRRVRALYGFSGGGYNARRVWSELGLDERRRIRKVVVVGAPGVTPASFPGSREVVIQPDPPEGHMAGPKALLQSRR
jgi:hypothetical protein